MQTTGQHCGSDVEWVTLQFASGKKTIAKKLDALCAPRLRRLTLHRTRNGALSAHEAPTQAASL